MGRVFSLSLLFVLLMSATAFADHLVLDPNGGSGSNFAYFTHATVTPSSSAVGLTISFLGI